MSKKKNQEPEQKQELCPECGHPAKSHGELDEEFSCSWHNCYCTLGKENISKINLLNEMHLALKCASTVNANGPAPTDGWKAWGVTSPF